MPKAKAVNTATIALSFDILVKNSKDYHCEILRLSI